MKKKKKKKKTKLKTRTTTAKERNNDGRRDEWALVREKEKIVCRHRKNHVSKRRG